MEKLSIEEKAKAYDEALERVEKIRTGKYETTFIFTEGLFEHIFPELKESEDEKMKREILELVSIAGNGNQFEEIKDWLEKHKYTEKDLDKAYECADEVQYRRGYEDAKKEIEKQGEQKPVWSDEDEAYRVDILVKLEPHITDDNFTDVQNWFKSIKDRVQPQPKQEWSEEDKVWIDRACMLLNELNDLSNLTPAKIPSNVNKIIQQLNSIKDRVQPKVELTQLDKNILEAAIAFVEQNNHFNCWGGIDKHTVLSALRSLRPRNNWKPSDEQMKALADALSLAKNCGEESSFYLRRLYEQLKKLKKKNKL